MAVPGKRVRIAFGGLPGAGEPTTWHDVTPYLRYVRTTFGRSQDIERIEAGTAKVILLNTDGRFTPTNTQSPYSPSVRPFAQMEVEWISDEEQAAFTLGTSALGVAALYDTAPSTARVFRGLIERYTPTWVDGPDAVNQYAAMEIDAGDFFVWLQKAPWTGGTYGEQTAGARIAAVLADCGNPFPTDIDAGGVTLAAGTVAGNPLEYCKDVAYLDGGLFYARGNTFTFKSRTTLQGSSTYLTEQAVLGDQAGQFRGTDLALSLDHDFVVNRVKGKTSNATAIPTQEDTESQSYYMIRELDLGTTEIVSVSELTARAQFELETYADARWRVDGVEFELTDPNLDSEDLINLDLMHRVTVKRTPKQGDAVSIPCFVQGFEHEATPESWKMRISVSSAPTGWQLGVSELGTGTIL